LKIFTNFSVNQIEENNKKLAEWDRNNPFAFDEALARAGSESNINPYYTKTLDEFMQGIRASSRRSVEDMTRTIGELNVDASKLSEKERLSTQEAIRSSEEGYAGAGLFFGGQRERTTGLQEVQGIQNQEGIETKLGRDIGSQRRADTRWREDLALKESHQKWTTEAERKTALEVDVAKKRRENELDKALARAQFSGTLGGNLQNRLSMENTILSGY